MSVRQTESLSFFCDKDRARRVLYIGCFLRGTRRVGYKYHATVGVSRPTINKFYNAFRERIAELCETESPFENGEIELDESYLGARRVEVNAVVGRRASIPLQTQTAP